MKKVILGCIIVALALNCTGMSFAAQFNDEAELARKVIQAERRLSIFRVMSLKEEEKVRFWPVYEGYVSEMEDINDRMVALIRELSMNYENVSDEKALEMLTEMFSIEKDKLVLKDEYVKKFEKILPGVKVARFFQTEEKLDAQRDMNLAAQVPLIGGMKGSQRQ